MSIRVVVRFRPAPWMLVPLATAWLSMVRPAHGEVRSSVVILAVPGLSADDVRQGNLPTLDAIAARAGLGWLVTRTAARPSLRYDPDASGYLTIGTGTRAVAEEPGLLAGQSLLDQLRAAQRGLDHPVSIGALGGTCRRAGLSIHVAGDADTMAARRGATLLAMDPRGAVDADHHRHRDDVTAPYGIRDAAEWPLPPASALSVWVFGDLARAEQYAPACTDTIARAHRRRALDRLEHCLRSRFLPALDEARGSQRPLLAFILAPAPSRIAHPSDRLTPLVVLEPSWCAGLLTSPSTRRIGLVLNTDILPTIARFLCVPTPRAALGRPMSVVPVGPAPAPRWRQQHRLILSATVSQYSLGSLPYVRTAFLLAVTLCLALACRGTGAAVWMGAARALAGAMAFAIAPQVLSGFGPPAPAPVGAVVLGTTAAAGALLAWLSPRTARLVACALFAVACAAVMADLCAGGRHVRDAWLSYSAMHGTRLYGIGNEMAGALLAMLVACVLPLWRSRVRLLAPCTIALFAYAAGLPRLGADLGASLAGLVTSVAAWVIPARSRLLSALGGVALIAGIAGLAAILALTDAGPGASHLGRAFSQDASLPAIAARKIMLNVTTLTRSIWTVATCLGVLGMLLASARSRAPSRRADLALWLVGLASIFALNDTGIVAAGLYVSISLPASVLLGGREGTEAPEAQGVGDHGHR